MAERLLNNLMRPLDQYGCIQEEGTIKEAVELMETAGARGRPLCLLVVGPDADQKKVIKGFISPAEIVFGLTHHFLKGAESSGPIFWEGQLRAECMNNMDKYVSEIMSPFKGYALETDMLMEAVFLLKKHQTTFLPVMNQDDVTGMMHLEDILDEIARITQGPNR